VPSDATTGRRQEAARRNALIIRSLHKLGIEVRETPRGVVVLLPGSYFAFDQHTITPETPDQLKKMLRVANDQAAYGRLLAIAGHTDSRGSNRYNREPSLRRTRTAEGELAFSNVSRDRMITRGLGEGRPGPVAPNGRADGSADPAGGVRNHRLEIVFLSPDQE